MITQIDNSQAQTEAKRIEDAHSQSGVNDTNDLFQELFLAQLKYQDPMEPMDNNEYITQMAQFSQVETLQTISAKLDKLGSGNSIAEAAALIGNEIQGLDRDSLSIVSGIASSMRVEEGDILFNIGSSEINLNDITSVKWPGIEG